MGTGIYYYERFFHCFTKLGRFTIKNTLFNKKAFFMGNLHIMNMKLGHYAHPTNSMGHPTSNLEA